MSAPDAPARWWLSPLEAATMATVDLAVAESNVERQRARRDDAIRRAVKGGASLREVARVVGLSHPQVANIVRENPGGRP